MVPAPWAWTANGSAAQAKHAASKAAVTLKNCSFFMKTPSGSKK
jgi:hypothetical protein